MKTQSSEIITEVKRCREGILSRKKTPHLLFEVAEDVQVPDSFRSQKELVLNVSEAAISDFWSNSEYMEFSCRFAGIASVVRIPAHRIRACYEKETGEAQRWNVDPTGDTQPSPPQGIGSEWTNFPSDVRDARLARARSVEKKRDDYLERNLIPFFLIDVTDDAVLPPSLKGQKEVMLNVSNEQIREMRFCDGRIQFRAIFSGAWFTIDVPAHTVRVRHLPNSGVPPDPQIEPWLQEKLEAFRNRLAASQDPSDGVEAYEEVYAATFSKRDGAAEVDPAKVLLSRSFLKSCADWLQKKLEDFRKRRAASQDPSDGVEAYKEVYSAVYSKQDRVTEINPETVLLSRFFSLKSCADWLIQHKGDRADKHERKQWFQLANQAYTDAWRVLGNLGGAHSVPQLDEFELLVNWAGVLLTLNDHVQAANVCAKAWSRIGNDVSNVLYADGLNKLFVVWRNSLVFLGRVHEANNVFRTSYDVCYKTAGDLPRAYEFFTNWLASEDQRTSAPHLIARGLAINHWRLFGFPVDQLPLTVLFDDCMTEHADVDDLDAAVKIVSQQVRRSLTHFEEDVDLKFIAAQFEALLTDIINGDSAAVSDKLLTHTFQDNNKKIGLLLATGEYAAMFAPHIADQALSAAWSTLCSLDSLSAAGTRSAFRAAQNWQQCWSSMANRQSWAKEISTELCRRLGEQNLASPPDWLDELYGRFGQFHLRWMQDSLNDGEPEHLVEILSRVSSWRMATALLDELETQASQDSTLDLAATSDPSSESKDTQTLRHYQRLRLEVRRRIQQLHEKEHAAGYLTTDRSGVRGDGLGMGLGLGQDRPVRSAEDQARLDAEINALRAEYDAVYRDMQQAQAAAAMVPGYAALSVDRSTLNSQQLLAQLANPSRAQQALLIVFDHKIRNDAAEAHEQLSGALLLKDGQVHWHAMDEMAQGSEYLAQYEHWVKHNRTKGMAFRRGDTDRGDSVGNGDTDSPTLERELLNDQGLAITRESLWPSLGEWVKRTLWQPLAKQGLLNGVDEIVLVTQGQDAHSIPWQMGAPVAATAIKRYPGLMFYAMDTELLSRAACHEDAALGVAHYKGQERALPFARIEAKTLCEIWTQAGHPVQQDFDYLHPAQRVGSVHVAGHGNHALQAKQTAAAAACLSVGENTRWGLSELMNSPARPRQVYLSCCVAGRTTDLAGEQYGVTAALLQHGTREVVASYVSLEDAWGSALSIVTHSLMSQHGLDMKHALDQAQAMVTGRLPWDETAKAWVLKGWRERLTELIARMLEKRQAEVMSMDSAESLAVKIANRIQEEVFDHLPHLARERLDQESYLAWCQALARDFFDAGAGRTWSQERREALAAGYADELLQHAQWRMQPPALIAGSLAFATTAVGG